MIAARLPIQRSADARLLVIDQSGQLRHWPRSRLADLFHPSDLVIANDAATLPASLSGQHLPSGATIEVRLAGRDSLAPSETRRWTAVVFGPGDFRTRTEDRPQPPKLSPGDGLTLGPLHATVERILGHPRLIELAFDESPSQVLAGIACHGRPIQYSHLETPLDLWDMQTPIASMPIAFEPPSAGFVLDWGTLASLKASGVRFATITHAAGISSTGDPELDARLPLNEPYLIPEVTARMIRQAKAQRARIIAIGTTVVRALEHAAAADGFVWPGEGLATQRIGPNTRLRVVDSIVSGTHEPGTSHHELLRAFVDDETLTRMDRELELRGYRTHEFGDSVLVERAQLKPQPSPPQASDSLPDFATHRAG